MSAIDVLSVVALAFLLLAILGKPSHGNIGKTHNKIKKAKKAKLQTIIKFESKANLIAKPQFGVVLVDYQAQEYVIFPSQN